MKTIQLKRIPVTVYGSEDVFEYGEFFRRLLEAPANPEKGATIAEIRQTIRVLDALDGATDSLTLEDADFAILLQRVKSATFTANHRAFIDLVDYLEAMQ